jgi:hypothetical protein
MKIKGMIAELEIAVGRLGNKIILEMNTPSAAWLIQELEAPTSEWKEKRGELAGLLRRACQ